jgi:hypothetical protein
MATIDEVARDIAITIINKSDIPMGRSGDRYNAPKWAGDVYKIVYKAVFDAPKDYPNMQMDK